MEKIGKWENTIEKIMFFEKKAKGKILV